MCVGTYTIHGITYRYVGYFCIVRRPHSQFPHSSSHCACPPPERFCFDFLPLMRTYAYASCLTYGVAGLFFYCNCFIIIDYSFSTLIIHQLVAKLRSVLTVPSDTDTRLTLTLTSLHTYSVVMLLVTASAMKESCWSRTVLDYNT